MTPVVGNPIATFIRFAGSIAIGYLSSTLSHRSACGSIEFGYHHLH
jgi:hypothetical protein